MGANLRVLALMPHPDDMELLCAGTLIRLRRLGCEIHLATMTPGDKGSARLGPDEIAAIRRAEAKEGASTIGADYRCLEFRDCEIVFDNEARRRVAALVRAVDPQLVITTPPVDYMEDHEVTARLTRDGCFNAMLRNYPAEGEPTATFPYLYYTDSIGGRNLYDEPARSTCIVDITDVIDEKAAALACHRSQREFLSAQQGMADCVDTMRGWGATHGARVGTAYAEAFCQHLGHPFPKDDVLQRLLGSPVAR